MHSSSGRPKQIVVLITTRDSPTFLHSVYHTLEDNDEQPLIHYPLDGQVLAEAKFAKPTATRPNLLERISRGRQAATQIPVRGTDLNIEIPDVYTPIANVYKPGDEICLVGEPPNLEYFAHFCSLASALVNAVRQLTGISIPIKIMVVAGIFGSEMTLGPDVFFTQKEPFEKLPLAQQTLVIGPDNTGLRVQSYRIVRTVDGAVKERQMCNLPSLWRSFEQSPTMCYWIMLQTHKILRYKPEWTRKAKLFDREPEWEEVMSPLQALENPLANENSLSPTARRYRLRGYRIKHSEHEDLNIDWVVWSAEHD
ncbi:hypothetical protein FRC08_001561 [Ceratobasidium sp. 394]|nr:hypothetical protein FRC08_001561 [Ceratobasidium sp. 394]KAG9076918.1 hypothetical protein FS749_011236 [Ceratobasidium sp. UAMH 11750]